MNCLEPHPQLPFICTSGLDWDVKVWVPSCEQKPVMAGLSDIIRQNNSTRCRVWPTTGSDISENDSMWLVWRYLPEMLERNVSCCFFMVIINTSLYFFQRSRVPDSSTSSESLDSEEEGEEHIEGPTGCTTS